MELLARWELNLPALEVLAALREVGPPYEEAPSILGRLLIMSPGGVTQRLTRLEEQGLVVRVGDSGDRRYSRARLTAKGLGLVEEALKEYLELEERLFSHLAKGEQQTLVQLLDRLLVSITTESGHPKDQRKVVDT
jgi:DNA-binding MarR family transcriptional regulator